MRVLVIGANGQLGFAACAALRSRGHAVRGTVRRPDRAAGLADLGVEVVEADLTAPGGLGPALDDIEALLFPANPVAPRAGDDVGAFGPAVERLVGDADRAGVGRFVLVSVPETPVDDAVPAMRDKRATERRLATASMESVVLRFPPFMECWLALVGSSVPLRGEPRATIGRPSPFLRRFRRATGSLVEDRGVMLVPGPADHVHAFIAVADAATACACAVDAVGLAGQTIEVGGPEQLTWTGVATAYERALGRRVRIVSTPGAVFGALATVVRPIAAVPAATLALNRYLAAGQTPWPPGGAGLVDPATMTTVEGFLTAKAALPAGLPTVV